MILIMWCFVLHFVADFIMQSREMGQKKSTEFKWLIKHLQIHFRVFWLGLIVAIVLLEVQSPVPIWTIVMYAIIKGLAFSVWNVIFHGAIDWYIWKGYKLFVYKRIQKNPDHELLADDPFDKVNPWRYWEDKYFYDTIGLDQLLHGLTMLGLCWWMFL